jgi:hypothetical protein
MRTLWITALVTVMLALTALKALFNVVGDKGFPQDFPTRSSLQAHLKGVFVSPVQAMPQTFVFAGHTVSFGNLWMERQVKTHYFLAWFPLHRPRSDYFLCIRLQQGNEVFRFGAIEKDRNAFFVLKGAGGGFTSERSGFDLLFYQDIDPDTFQRHAVHLSLISSFDHPRPDDLTFTWESN